ELQERLVVEGDVIDVGEPDAALRQAVADGILRKARVVLLAREALLLRGGDDAAVLQQSGGAVVIVGRDPQDSHAAPFRASVQNCWSNEPGVGAGGLR